MKRKRFSPEQLSLNECILRIRDACASDVLDMIRRTSPDALHNDLGRWIRNNCGLWEHGTDRVVVDIIAAYHGKKYQIQSLSNNTYVHPDISFKLENSSPHMSVDRNLTHPDNCSGVIIEILIGILKNEHDSINKK